MNEQNDKPGTEKKSNQEMSFLNEGQNILSSNI